MCYQDLSQKFTALYLFTIFQLLQFKCVEGHPLWGVVTLCTNLGNRLHPHILAPGVPCWVEMFQVLVQNEYVI